MAYIGCKIIEFILNTLLPYDLNENADAIEISVKTNVNILYLHLEIYLNLNGHNKYKNNVEWK